MNSFTGTPSVTSVVHLAMPPAMPSKIAAAGERETRVVPRLRKIGAAWLRHSCRMPEEARVKDVLVVLSELLTNAVLHGTGDSVGYRSWSPEPGLIRFEIDDGTETEDPLPQAPSPLAESGRGLLLVSLFVKELGGDWGLHQAWHYRLVLPAHPRRRGAREWAEGTVSTATVIEAPQAEGAPTGTPVAVYACLASSVFQGIRPCTGLRPSSGGTGGRRSGPSSTSRSSRRQPTSVRARGTRRRLPRGSVA